METVKINGKDVPVIQHGNQKIPVLNPEVKVTIKNKHTGVVYKSEEDWKQLKIKAEDIQRDVLVRVPSLDLSAKTK
jgi:hypothetical protein